MLAATTMDTNSAATVNQVGFYANGTLLGSNTPGPYTYNWSNITPGTYTVTAQATDTASNSAASPPINLTVAGPIITNPTTGQTLHTPASIVLSATATSLTGSVTEVSYYDNGVLIGTASQSPYNFSWNNIPGGKHTITASAMDSTGVILPSAPVNITVEAPLSVTLTSPTAGNMTGDNFALSATVSEAGGTIDHVTFYDGTTLLGTVTQAPYGVVFKDMPAKTYTLTAQATDSFGQVATSAAVTVTVVANGSGGGAGAEVVYDIHTDQLNTPRMITDQSGNAVWQWDNDEAFGNNLPNQNLNSAGSAFVFNLRFPGQYYDIETATHYNNYRDYDPTTGRYIQSDPIGLDGGQFSTYGYVDGKPLSLADQNGEGPVKGVIWLVKICKSGIKLIRPVSKEEAVRLAKKGKDLQASKDTAKQVADAASGGRGAIKDPVHPDRATGSTEGRRPHYHVNPRAGGHIFYSVATWLTFESTVEGCPDHDCVMSYVMEGVDFINPLATPKDLMDLAGYGDDED